MTFLLQMAVAKVPMFPCSGTSQHIQSRYFQLSFSNTHLTDPLHRWASPDIPILNPSHVHSANSFSFIFIKSTNHLTLKKEKIVSSLVKIIVMIKWFYFSGAGTLCTTIGRAPSSKWSKYRRYTSCHLSENC